jgi:Cu+-exporting ATPase
MTGAGWRFNRPMDSAVMTSAAVRLERATPALLGVSSFGLLLVLYFAALTAVSGWEFTLVQFQDYWGFIVALGAGFGVQVALFARLRQVVHSAGPRAVMATTGTTSTAAMVSCCAHYLANVAPLLGTTGLVTFAAHYQVELFWTGLAFNAAGIAYIGRNLFNARREHARCVTA